jgi:hypothetical protein
MILSPATGSKLRQLGPVRRQKNGSSHWGGFRFRLINGGERFEGSWSYCDDPVGDGNEWVGTRASTRFSQNTFIPASINGPA